MEVTYIMGACGISGQFKAYDWREGIRRVQEEAQSEYGYDPYNGEANNVSFSYGGDKSNLTQKQLSAYIDDRMESLYKREGEVIKVDSVGFTIFTTEFVESTTKPSEVSWAWNSVVPLLKGAKRPAILIAFDGYGKPKAYGAGTVAELKQKAHELLRSEFYRRYMYIVKKDKYICCKGKAKQQSKTTRKTDAKTLVVEQGLYRYYGWAPE